MVSKYILLPSQHKPPDKAISCKNFRRQQLRIPPQLDRNSNGTQTKQHIGESQTVTLRMRMRRAMSSAASVTLSRMLCRRTVSWRETETISLG